MKVRVPIIGTVNKSISIETDAPSRAEVTAAISAAIAASKSSGTSPGVVTVIWRFIREIPANIVKLAALTGNGLITRKANGDMAVRSIAVANTGRLTVTNADGDAGNPTLDMADISARSAWGRPNNTSGKPVAIQSTGDKAVLHESGGALSFDTINASYIQASATSRVFGRKTSGAGNGEELTLSDVLDFIGSAAQGDILYRGASSWARLPAGTAGYVLSTNGAGANPSWVAQSGGGGGGNITPDTHPSSPNAQDDEFETGSSINTSQWTAFNVSTGTTTLANGSLVFLPALTASRNFGGYSQPVTGSWEYTAQVSTQAPSAALASGASGGMFVAAGTGGKIIWIGFGSGTALTVQKLNAFNSFNSNPVLVSNSIPAAFIPGASFSNRLYLRISYNGTTLVFSASSTGIAGTFVTVFSEASATFLGTPALIGLGFDNEHASAQAILLSDWFRKTA